MPLRSLSTTITLCAWKLSTGMCFVQNLSITCVKCEKGVELLSTGVEKRLGWMAYKKKLFIDLELLGK
jgi:hypothetical protein